MDDGGTRRADGPGKRVRSEHRRLDSLFHEARAILEAQRTHGDVAATVGRLQEAVDGHLTQEDRLYYPPIWALRPQYKDALQALLAAHDEFRRRLAEIVRDVAEGAFAAALTRFDAFAEDFGRHEAREEQLLERIERELPARG
jgi:hypothetical protein